MIAASSTTKLYEPATIPRCTQGPAFVELTAPRHSVTLDAPWQVVIFRPPTGRMDGTGVAILVPSPPPAISTAHQKIPTPSRAELGPRSRFTFDAGMTADGPRMHGLILMANAKALQRVTRCVT